LLLAAAVVWLGMALQVGNELPDHPPSPQGIGVFAIFALAIVRESSVPLPGGGVWRRMAMGFIVLFSAALAGAVSGWPMSAKPFFQHARVDQLCGDGRMTAGHRVYVALNMADRGHWPEPEFPSAAIRAYLRAAWSACLAQGLDAPAPEPPADDLRGIMPSVWNEVYASEAMTSTHPRAVALAARLLCPGEWERGSWTARHWPPGSAGRAREAVALAFLLGLAGALGRAKNRKSD
jgi:hypothetical protein